MKRESLLNDAYGIEKLTGRERGGNAENAGVEGRPLTRFERAGYEPKATELVKQFQDEEDQEKRKKTQTELLEHLYPFLIRLAKRHMYVLPD